MNSLKPERLARETARWLKKLARKTVRWLKKANEGSLDRHRNFYGHKATAVFEPMLYLLAVITVVSLPVLAAGILHSVGVFWLMEKILIIGLLSLNLLWFRWPTETLVRWWNRR